MVANHLVDHFSQSYDITLRYIMLTRVTVMKIMSKQSNCYISETAYTQCSINSTLRTKYQFIILQYEFDSCALCVFFFVAVVCSFLLCFSFFWIVCHCIFHCCVKSTNINLLHVLLWLKNTLYSLGLNISQIAWRFLLFSTIFYEQYLRFIHNKTLDTSRL